jgi:hypothetical protein
MLNGQQSVYPDPQTSYFWGFKTKVSPNSLKVLISNNKPHSIKTRNCGIKFFNQ